MRFISDMDDSKYKPGQMIDCVISAMRADSNIQKMQENNVSCFHCGYANRVKTIVPAFEYRINDSRVETVHDMEFSCGKNENYTDIPRYSCIAGKNEHGTCATCIHNCGDIIVDRYGIMKNTKEAIKLCKCDRTTWSRKKGVYYRTYFTCKFYEKKEK